jgi:OOP family OmpA-OmpF porin
MKRIAALLILFVSSAATFAQTQKEWLNYADAAFNNGDYKNAVTYYLKVIARSTPSDATKPYEVKPYTPPPKKKNTVTPIPVAIKQDSSLANVKDSVIAVPTITNTRQQYVVHQIAECYRLSRDYDKAEKWYQQSLKGNPSEYPFESYWYGDALMKNKKYPAANLQFDVTVTAAEKRDSSIYRLAKLKMAGCALALDPNSVQKGVTVTECDTAFNTGIASFSVNYYGDENTVQFGSAREGNTVPDPKKQKAKYTSDIYMLNKTESGWKGSKKIDGPINTNQNEAAGILASDKSRFFFTRWSTVNLNEIAIYFSRLFNGEWLIAQKMNDKINLDGFKSKDPCLVPDGSIIYFSSNRPGGYGKMDLWYESIDEDGRTYGEPVNMGPLFNTGENEVSPFFHQATSTLYFSSDGHPGFGGLDVLKSSFNSSDSIWSLPKNLGQPINSSNDDSYFILDESQQHGFVTSDRKVCAECNGGACYKVYSVEKEANVYDVSGSVYNSETNELLKNATITFKDIRSDWEPFVITTDSSGKYFYLLKEGVELYMKAQKNNFLGDAGTVITKGLTESKHFEKDFFLSPISTEGVTFPNVEFDDEMVVLRPASKKVLDNLADFLKLNNTYTVHIDSHADADERGLDKYNMQISEDRSKSCVDYLVSKGIARQRLLAKGYGNTQPAVAKAKSAAEHQKNRITSFKVVK